MKRKKAVTIILSAAAVLILCTVCFFRYVFIDQKAVELTTTSSWENSITYDMLSGKLKKVISEEEFYDRSDSGRLNLYRKLENLKVEKRRKHDPSTNWWKTPQCYDYIETEEKSYYIEIGFDCRTSVFGFKIINFYTHIYEYEK